MKEKAAGLLKRYSAHSLSVHGIYWPVYGTLLSFTAVILLSMGFTNDADRRIGGPGQYL